MSLQHDFVRVDASGFCVQISRTRAEMINWSQGRSQNQAWNPTEREASTVRQPRTFLGVSWTLRVAQHARVARLGALLALRRTHGRLALALPRWPPRRPVSRKPRETYGVFGLWRPLSRSDSSRFGSFLNR